MLVHFGPDNLEAQWTRATVVVGTFDGVHLGHRALVSRAVELAQRHEEPCVVVTFDRHPRALLDPQNCPPSLGTLEQNVIALRQAGASVCLIQPFTEEFSRRTAGSFLDDLLRGALKASRLVVGHDFAFGRGREGTPEWLQARIETEVLEPVMMGDVRISSSEIRRRIAAGEIGRVPELLGRPFALAGVVVPGQKLGRTLGFPTINLARSSQTAVPADGVYAGIAQTPRGTFGAAISVGMRPTVAGTSRTVEAFLLDYPGESLYGAPVQLEFHHWIRPELAFSSLDELTQHMGADVQKSRELLAKSGQK